MQCSRIAIYKANKYIFQQSKTVQTIASSSVGSEESIMLGGEESIMPGDSIEELLLLTHTHSLGGMWSVETK